MPPSSALLVSGRCCMFVFPVNSSNFPTFSCKRHPPNYGQPEQKRIGKCRQSCSTLVSAVFTPLARHMPNRARLRLRSFDRALAARCGEHDLLLPAVPFDRVHQPRLGVHADVGIHLEIPLVALLRLVRLGVAFGAGVSVELGAAISVASTTVPALSSRSFARRRSLTRSTSVGRACASRQVPKPKRFPPLAFLAGD